MDACPCLYGIISKLCNDVNYLLLLNPSVGPLRTVLQSTDGFIHNVLDAIRFVHEILAWIVRSRQVLQYFVVSSIPPSKKTTTSSAATT